MGKLRTDPSTRTAALCGLLTVALTAASVPLYVVVLGVVVVCTATDVVSRVRRGRTAVRAARRNSLARRDAGALTPGRVATS